MTDNIFEGSAEKSESPQNRIEEASIDNTPKETPAPTISPELAERKQYEARTPIQGAELLEQYMQARLAEAGPGNELATMEAIAPTVERFHKLSEEFPDLKGVRYNPKDGERIESPIDRMETYLQAGEARQRNLRETQTRTTQKEADKGEVKSATNGQELIDQYTAEIVGAASEADKNDAITKATEASQKLREAMAKYPDIKSDLFNTKTGDPLTAAERAQMILDKAKKLDEQASLNLPRTQEEAIAFADALIADEHAVIVELQRTDPRIYRAKVQKGNITYEILRARTGAILIEATNSDGQKQKVGFAGKPEATNQQ